MRTIAGYDAADLERHVRCRVIATLPSAATVDLSDYLLRVTVTDALEAASSASIELAREAAAYFDPLAPTPTLSPFLTGNPVTVEISDDGATWTRIFDGELTSGSNPYDEVASRITLSAAGRSPEWRETQLTSAVYAASSVEAIVQALFVAHGGLTAPGDFDLPVTGRTITSYQLTDGTLADAARNLLGPLGLSMWWDPVQRKLSTRALDSWTPNQTVAATRRGNFTVGWAAPEATRIRLNGGALPNVSRIERGEWDTPVSPPVDPAGVRITSGSKSDEYDSLYWAQADGSLPHTGNYVAGEYLWIRFMGSEFDMDGTGYRGPEGVTFAVPGGGTLSTVVMDPNSSLITVTVILSVDGERVGALSGKWIGYVLCGIDVGAIIPPPGPVTPSVYWESLVSSSAVSLNWEVRGRQVSLVSEQLTAQAWDDASILLHGDYGPTVDNPALLVTGDEYQAVEDEVTRLLAVALEARYPGQMELRGMDAEIEIGDVLRSAHPKQAGNLLLRAQQVTQTWQPTRTNTAVSGVVAEAP